MAADAVWVILSGRTVLPGVVGHDLAYFLARAALKWDDDLSKEFGRQ